jgi:hypothetical protein
MVRNASGSYELYEVKAKSHIRKEVTNDGVKEHIGEVEKCFINDVSFQKYVIDEKFASWGIPALGKVFVAHLNAEYVKHGEISIRNIVKIEEVGSFSQITVIQGGSKAKEKTVDRDDTFVPVTVVKEAIAFIRSECLLSEQEFNSIHPFTGSKHLEYFGKDKSFGTIYSIPIHHSRAPLIACAHSEGRHSISHLTEDELGRIGNDAGKFIERYWQSENKPFLDRDTIRTRLNELRFPICFYDYESASVPVPLLDGTSPYQQAVVQYSLHKLYEDGRIEHFGALLSEESDGCQIVDIPDMAEDTGFALQKNRHIIGSQSDLFRLFISDIGSDISDSSFVVWYDPFENSRNKEIARSYGEFENVFLKINENTFDLYKIFAEYHYFDRGFLGSASIKKVLPVLVPSLSYDTLAIGKGDKAMRALQDLIEGRIVDENSRIETIRNLLIYCRQDSYAMLAIYEVLRSAVSVSESIS